MVRVWFFFISVASVGLVLLAAQFWPRALWLLWILVPLVLLGLYDSLQKRHTVLRNFPLVGHGRYIMEAIRPEVQQYFIEKSNDALPIAREFRNVIYERAKGQLETKPYGTQEDVYQIGYEWIAHSIDACKVHWPLPRIEFGRETCTTPYRASLLNISAMSFGAISSNAVRALNRGAYKGGFAHNTGEGGVSPYHLEGGGDLIWQIGTGYFGCRTPDGEFDRAQFREQARHANIRMIELKLSQGAKPGHGGVLPGAKVNVEIARIRGVPVGETVISPPAHSAFSTPLDLLELVAELRRLAGGKPVGLKLCVGREVEIYALCKAMLESGLCPDFITVDGGEGGTGAAPLEFSNSVGMPIRDGLVFVHSSLRGAGLRDRLRLVASGKILSAFHMVRALALGADTCASARGMMLALGCIQSLRCNTNRCPTGVTTQNPALVYGLDVADKSERVYRFHRGTLRGLKDLLEAMGLESPQRISPHHMFRRVDDLHAMHFGELHPLLDPGQLLEEKQLPERLQREWRRARPDRWSVD